MKDIARGSRMRVTHEGEVRDAVVTTIGAVHGGWVMLTLSIGSVEGACYAVARDHEIAVEEVRYT